MNTNVSTIAVIMGSDSDWPIMKDAVDVLLEFEVNIIKQVVSAHRTPDDLKTFAQFAEDKLVDVIIAGAGGAAHLPGMMASFSLLPIIGVPINTTSLQGMDSLLSIVQMPKGIPVATVAINNSTNAALLAIRICAIKDEKLSLKLKKYQENMAAVSRSKKLP
jgi:5-(carboxyamino)imidazole ribonucleotide mutase